MIYKNKKLSLSNSFLSLFFFFIIIISQPISKSAFSQYIYNKGNKFSAISPLMTAINSNDTQGVKFFAKAGPDAVNKQNIGGASALHIAARKTNGENYINILINNGADVNLVDNSGWTPLMRAAIEGKIKNMMILLKNGANPNTSNNMNDTIIKQSAIANCNSCVVYGLKYINYKILGQDLLQSQIDESIVIATKRSNLQMVEILRQYQQKVNNIIRAEVLIKERQEALMRAEEERLKNKKKEEELHKNNHLDPDNSKDYDNINLDNFIKKIKNYILVIGPPALIIENKEQTTNNDINQKSSIQNIKKKNQMIDAANKNMQILEEEAEKEVKNTKKHKKFFFFKKKKDQKTQKEVKSSINHDKKEGQKSKSSNLIEDESLEEVYIGPSTEPQKRIIYKLHSLKEIKKESDNNFPIEQGIDSEKSLDRINYSQKEKYSFIDKSKNFFKNLFTQE